LEGLIHTTMATSSMETLFRPASGLSTVRIQLRRALEAKDRINEIAGSQLEKFDRLSDHDIRGFESKLAAFKGYFKNFAMRFGDDILALSNRGHDLFSEVELRFFVRQWAYARVGKQAPDLHERMAACMTPTHNHSLLARINAARRLHWVQVREQAGEDPYIEDRYTQPDQDIGSLRQQLGERHAWLLDFSIILTCETALMVDAIDVAKILIDDWESKSRALRAAAVARGLVAAPALNDYTTDVTRQVLEDENAEDTACPICDYQYAHVYCEVRGTEPAVKTTCNHILGSHCLQRWTGQGHCTCPLCRGVLYTANSIPECIRQEYRRMESILERMRVGDRYYDQFLAEGNVEIHSAEFTSHLNLLLEFVDHSRVLLTTMRWTIDHGGVRPRDRFRRRHPVS
jgi:hypothetical protein